ncbi:P-loop containing nucleoside triphosphate hydrolase protein [Ochromonadaceae sp. CCMP2298]|nr:P-loop containing nucleoside triphosphate hydrolase protein [Ochromonadaceae sp. CCMP2298]
MLAVESLSLLLCMLCSVVISKSAFDPREDKNLTAPDFFMIGAGKSSTTSLHELIVQHQEMCITSKFKEHHYFNTAARWNVGSADYLRKFKNRTGCVGGYTIDSTPAYYRIPAAPRNLQRSYSEEDLKKKKFILLIKEPVSREFSWFKHVVRYCQKTMLKAFKTHTPQTFRSHGRSVFGYKKRIACDPGECGSLGCGDIPYNETTIQTPEVFLDSFQTYHGKGRVQLSDSAYILHIRDWLKVIKREQLFVINSQTLYENTTDTMRRLSRFLGLKSDWGEKKLPHSNENTVLAAMPCKLHDKLAAYYEKHNAELYAFLRQGGPESEPAFAEFRSTRDMCTD